MNYNRLNALVYEAIQFISRFWPNIKFNPWIKLALENCLDDWVDFENDLVFNLQCLQKRSARKRFRRSILDEWPECAYCGRKHPTTLDHVVPRARGGKQDRNNLIGACGACNLEKSDLDWFVWYRGQVFWTPEREDRILSWINQQPEPDPPSVVWTNWMEPKALLLPETA